jgi:hypothetical protein
MAKSARTFYLLAVKPACDDFLANPLSVRCAMFAAIALHHLADYRALENYVGPDNHNAMKRAVKEVRDSLVARCPDLALIGDIADAAKHSRLTTPNGGARLVQDIEKIDVTPGIFGAPFPRGVFGEAACLYVELADGIRRPFAEILQNALLLLQAELDLGP